MDYVYKAKVIRVVDGDTFHVEVDLGFDCSIKESIRLSDYNAPERNTFTGKELTKEAALLLTGEWVVIKTIKDKREKYGRYLAKLYYGSDFDQDYTTWLIAKEKEINARP